MNFDARLAELGIVLPQLSAPKYSYAPYRLAGDIAFLAGAVPRLPDGSYLTGKIGGDRTVEEGAEAARLCTLHLLATARSITGSLDDIEFLKINGMVNAVPDFTEHPRVMEGSSRLLLEVMGEQGRHARTAVGMGSLPMNIRVEVEAIVRIRGR